MPNVDDEKCEIFKVETISCTKFKFDFDQIVRRGVEHA